MLDKQRRKNSEISDIMKVIKNKVQGRELNLSKNFRQSQACDRCRLKKIKCDGLKPSCSNCSKINFICKTSDKLTRRGLPKGYTEHLENEVVRLQQLVDNLVNNESSNTPLQQVQHQQEVRENIPLPTNVTALPFVNDTFHRFNNYSFNLNYIGNATWNTLIDKKALSFKHLSEPYVTTFNMDPILQLMINNLKLNSINGLPQYLTNKYTLAQLKDMLIMSIKNFENTQNSLIPLLYPSKKWEAHLISLINESSLISNPISLMCLLYIIQFNWNCFKDFDLFIVTKLILLTVGNDSVNIIQMSNLAVYYFMATTNIGEFNCIIWANELLQINYDLQLKFASYINASNIVDIAVVIDKPATINHEARLVSFWCSQFLHSWWTLIQGMPKTNFLIQEFHPRQLMSTNLKSLIPFNLVLDLIINKFDGINLLQSVESFNSNLIIEIENFRSTLNQWKLYYNFNQNVFTTTATTKITLERSDIVEIQLTLFYLTLLLLTNVTDHSNFNEDISFEILSIYYLLMLDSNTMVEQPRQFHLMKFLPFSNEDVINLCLQNLVNWSNFTKQNKNIKKKLNWKFNKFKQFLAHWSKLWFHNDFSNEIYLQLSKNFELVVSTVNDANIPCDKLSYIKTIQEFNMPTRDQLTNVPSQHHLLLRSDSKAIMDQFNIFSNPTNSGNLSQFFKNLTNPAPATAIPTTQQPNTPFTHNNISMNSLYFLSPLLGGQEESDDGYAEDDDEDDDDNIKPLEIPFSSKRRTSLFQQRHIQPPQQTTSTTSRKHTLDEIIMKNHVKDKDNEINQDNDGNRSRHDIVGTNYTPISESSHQQQQHPSKNQDISAHQIIETPRTFVNMLLLPPPSDQQNSPTPSNDRNEQSSV